MILVVTSIWHYVCLHICKHALTLEYHYPTDKGLITLISHLSLLDTRTSRAPLRPHTAKHDIYVTSARTLAPLHKRLEELFFTDRCDYVTIHGLGNCIYNAVRLAVDFCDKHMPWFQTETVTSTEVMIDDYTPLVQKAGDSDKEFVAFSRSRLVSAVHIVVTRISKQ